MFALLLKVQQRLQLLNYFKYTLICLLITLVYYLAAHLGLALAFEQGNTSPVWLPSGIAIAALLYFGLRVWPGVFLGAFLINISTDVSLLVASGIASGNTLEAVVASYLIMHFIKAYPFRRIGHVIKFFIIILLAAMISATVGVVSISLGGAAEWSIFNILWLTWWLGDAFGALLVTPMLLSWVRRYEGKLSVVCILEALVLLAVALFCVGACVQREFFHCEKRLSPCHLFSLPLVIWAAYRFRQQGVTLLIILVSLSSAYTARLKVMAHLCLLPNLNRYCYFKALWGSWQ